MPTAELSIDSIAAGGDGVARADGFVVFVPRTAPGDIVLVSWRQHGRFARGEVREIVSPSAVRVDPPCEHYVRDRCGGCQLQHMSYGAQLEAKGNMVRDSLARIGRRDVAPPPVRPSAEQWRYRRKLTLALRRPRGRGKWIAGLHPYDAPGRVFALRDCPITHEAVLSAWREVLAAGEELPRAAELRGAVRVGDWGTSFVLEGGTSWPSAWSFFERTPSLISLWWAREGSTRAKLLAGRGGEEGAAESPGLSFEQVNAGVALELDRHVIERVTAHSPRTVVDAYSGLGDLAAALAGPDCHVTAIELDASAAEWCARRLAAGSRSLAARVEEALPGALPADVVVLNPPRGGVDERVTSELQSSAASTRAIVYVSCDAATLARDLARLPRWRIASLVAFDMFPQTAHVETVCELVPDGGGEEA